MPARRGAFPRRSWVPEGVSTRGCGHGWRSALALPSYSPDNATPGAQGVASGESPNFRQAAAWVISPMTWREESDELVFVGVGRRGSPGGDVQFGENVADVPVDRFLAHAQFGGDGLVGFARRDQAEHLLFVRRQPMGAPRRCTLAERVDPGEVRRG